MSSLLEISTDLLGNRVVVTGEGERRYSAHPGFCTYVLKRRERFSFVSIICFIPSPLG